MKKIISLFASALLMSVLFLSCNAKKSSGKLQVVTTIYPVYDWVENILGEKSSDVEVTLLLDNGVDLHNYQPSADDIVKIINSDVFIYVGGESDEWVDDVLENAVNKNMVVVNLLEEIGDAAKEEEFVEGMQQEDEHEHEHEHEDEDEDEHEHEHHHDEEEAEYDEHVWLSLRNASVLTKSIASALKKVDSKNADVYEANSLAYIEKLSILDKEYSAAVSSAKRKTLLFADRFPFRYMTEDYGLKYYAAFIGCSAETEASFDTVIFLSKKLDELNLPVVLTIEGKSHRIAETVVAGSKKKNQKILSLNSLQASSKEDFTNGKDYLSVMYANLNVLKEALK